jgi:hypothetical protein
MRTPLIILAVAVTLGVFLVAVKDFPKESASNMESVATTSLPTPTTTPTTSPITEVWECTADGFICPDGSTVGRTGPRCEWAPCPSIDAPSDTVSTYLGGRVARFNLTLNPYEVVSDSRCAPDVQCIWAGTVEVRTRVESPAGHGEHVFTLNEPQTIENFTVTLIEVTPSSSEEAKDPEHGYWFTFEIKKS